MPKYEVIITQTYHGEFWAENEEQLLENVNASELTFDSEDVEEYWEMEEKK